MNTNGFDYDNIRISQEEVDKAIKEATDFLNENNDGYVEDTSEYDGDKEVFDELSIADLSYDVLNDKGFFKEFKGSLSYLFEAYTWYIQELGSIGYLEKFIENFITED